MAGHDSRDGSNAQRVAAIFRCNSAAGRKNWGWGNNNDGQLVAGAGGGFAKLDPSPPGPTPTKIAAGAYHTCILAGATTGVFCRGNNNDVQSGPTPPGIVPGTTSAVDVAAGGSNEQRHADYCSPGSPPPPGNPRHTTAARLPPAESPATARQAGSIANSAAWAAIHSVAA